MKRSEKDGLMEMLYKLCPEIKELDLHPIVLGKGSRY